MRIVAAEARTVRVAAAARSASASFEDITATALAIETDIRRNGNPLVGLAFDSVGRYDHTALLRERFIPRLLAADPERYAAEEGGIDPSRAWAVLMTDEKPGGHGERGGAVGLLDAALWDVAAKAAEVPLWRYLTDLEPGVDDRRRAIAEVYASGGHYRPQHDVERLCDDISRAIARGHRRFKIKIGGAELPKDIERGEAVLARLAPGMSLAVDANGVFNLESALRYAEALADYPVMWLEEPVNPLDFEAHRALAEHTGVPLAVGKNLFSADDARNLLRYGGLRPDRDTL
jgi:D(-)-tartrate dehydratase